MPLSMVAMRFGPPRRISIPISAGPCPRPRPDPRPDRLKADAQPVHRPPGSNRPDQRPRPPDAPREPAGFEPSFVRSTAPDLSARPPAAPRPFDARVDARRRRPANAWKPFAVRPARARHWCKKSAHFDSLSVVGKHRVKLSRQRRRHTQISVRDDHRRRTRSNKQQRSKRSVRQLRHANPHANPEDDRCCLDPRAPSAAQARKSAQPNANDREARNFPLFKPGKRIAIDVALRLLGQIDTETP